ncbi:hypothetical protein SFR_1008 [Streptomyces sp. FR-008]|nr:hypothetical protein SFR_1008 [Streptomyces sp. FR-008]
MGGGFAFGSGRGGGCSGGGAVSARHHPPFFVLGAGRVGWGVLKRRTG